MEKAASRYQGRGFVGIGAALFMPSLFSLVTAESFNAVFGLSSGAWESIFVITVIIGFLLMLYGAYLWRNQGDGLQKEVGEIFSESNKKK